jgi:proliferating cell nuclear antigen
MELIINDKSKIDLFIALFHLLKNCSSVVKLEFYIDKCLIQGMDKSHVCLFYIELKSTWFNLYTFLKNESFVVDSNSLFLIFSRIQDSQTLNIIFHGNDTLNINVLSLQNDHNINTDFNRYFQLPLIDLELESYQIPDMEYDADFTINSKQFNDIMSQLMLFGDILNINCNENEFNLESNGDNGKMKVALPIHDLVEFSITEGENINLSYSLNYINKMCLTNKLSKDIEISLTNDYPIKIKYSLGNDSCAIFYIAPKIV